MQDLPPSQVLSVLQFRAISEPLLPNLKTFLFWPATGELTSFIPSLLSPRTTAIDIGFIGSNHPKAVIASMITTLPTLYPNLQKISLSSLPRDPIIVAATSELLLSTNRDAIRSFCATSPLTEEAREVISKLPDLCELHMVVDGPASLPTLILPNLTDISVEFNHDHDWLEGFREATLGKLASVTFTSDSDLIGDFLEAFKSVALTTSISETLSTFKFCTPSPWRPNYHSLLSFVHLEDLEIEFSCEGGCSSTVDDDTIINLAQTMPKLRYLYLGDSPCQTPTGVTVKGLTALAYYCRRLWMLRVHFQVDSLNPQEDLQVISGPGSTILRGDCALSDLHVGEIHVPKGSVLMVALTLLRIFPNLENIEYASEECEQVADAIWHSKQLTDRSSKKHPFATL